MAEMKKCYRIVLCDRRVPTKEKCKFYKTINVFTKFQHINKIGTIRYVDAKTDVQSHKIK